MALHDDLLEQAFHLAHKERKRPKQASLRRAVSTAYYALFHLLISESVANWNQHHLRTSLGRAFDHATMKGASNRVSDSRAFPFIGEDPLVVANLKAVAAAFTQLQANRHTADYDNTAVWTRSDALTLVELAEKAFAIWKSIRKEKIAQAYLVSLLVKHRG